MSETTYYQRNKEVMLNSVKEYYQNNIQRIIQRIIKQTKKDKKRIWKEQIQKYV